MSEIERYSGLCIDGPNDGKRVDCELPRMAAAIWPKMSSYVGGDEPNNRQTATVTKFEYQHVPFHFHTSAGRNVSVGFWVDRSIQEPRIWVLERLVASYEKKAKP